MRIQSLSKMCVFLFNNSKLADLTMQIQTIKANLWVYCIYERAAFHNIKKKTLKYSIKKPKLVFLTLWDIDGKEEIFRWNFTPVTTMNTTKIAQFPVQSIKKQTIYNELFSKSASTMNRGGGKLVYMYHNALT